ncbi:hypothetical protein [Leifsonia aquatica]|uniref:hypothetical protein n=1 Tax=Leifsonia aquatica TaxID=144185 RepID=UPI001F06525B|nr:hypothetical protein [Leifsonia aquatica]
MRHLRDLRSPRPSLGPRRFAYRVPWHVDRSTAPHYRIVNTSREVLRGVSICIAGSARLHLSGPTSVRPGESVRASLSGGDPARDTLLVVRWFPPDGREYLWQIAF